MAGATLEQRKLRTILSSLLVLLIVLAAWRGNLDGQSSNYIESSMLGAGAIYATARGINAVVSVLQGTELDLPLLTLSVGEILDPINDLIERFSGVMLIALASLGIQLLLLEVVTHTIFNTLLTLMGAGTVIAALWGDNRHYQVWLRLFLVSLIVRFSLAITVLLASFVDTVFLLENEQANHEAMVEFHKTASTANAAIETGDRLKGDLEAARNDLEQTKEFLSQEIESLLSSAEQLALEKEKLKSMAKKPSWSNPFEPESEPVVRQRATIAALSQKVRQTENTIATLEASKAVQAENVICLDKKSRGKGCSLWETAKNKAGQVRESLSVTKKARYVKAQIAKIEEGIDDFARSAIYLLASTILKSIIFPLGFLFLIYRLSLSALRRTF